MTEPQLSERAADEPLVATTSQLQEDTSQRLLPGDHWTQSTPEMEQENDDADSALGDNVSSTASISSSILRYREINGRRYHSEQGDAQYWRFVIDLESRVSNDDQSNEALDINHHVLTLMYDGELYKAPLKKDIQVAVDIGTGTGIWAMDFADEFPNAKVVGTDISPIQPSWLPPNLEFQIDDCTQEWTFQENSLDYVHMRFLVGSIVDWPAFFKQAYRCLKPGGYIESHEASPDIGSDDDSVKADSAMGQWGKIFFEGGRKLQRPFSILEDDIQRQGMKEAGFVNIEETEVPIGGWSHDPKLKEAGQYFQAAILQDIEGTLMFIANLLGWTKEETHVFAARYRREIKSRKIHGYFLGKVNASMFSEFVTNSIGIVTQGSDATHSPALAYPLSSKRGITPIGEEYVTFGYLFDILKQAGNVKTLFAGCFIMCSATESSFQSSFNDTHPQRKSRCTKSSQAAYFEAPDSFALFAFTQYELFEYNFILFTIRAIPISMVPVLGTPGTPAIHINDLPAHNDNETSTSPQGYTYEGDGLVPINDVEEDLGILLRDYQIEGIDGPFWTDKLLRHILTKQRIRTELQTPIHHFSDRQVREYVERIRPSSQHSSSKIYLKIFTILLLVERPGDIGNFINAGFCDQELPITIRNRRACRMRDTEKRLHCFDKWRITWIENFELNQWKVNTPYLSPTQDQSLAEFRLWPKAHKPWRRSISHGTETGIDETDNSGAYGTVTRVDIHPTSHSYQQFLTGINLSCTKFAIKTLHTMDANNEQKFRTEWDMLKRFSGLVHPHLVTTLGAFSQGGKWSFIFPNASCDLSQYLETSNAPRGWNGACWFAKQLFGLMGALNAIHNPEQLSQDPIKRYGRHGDIKCDNILCFEKSGTSREKIFVISDFGLSAFNRDTSRSNIPNKQIPPVPGYRPPECDIEGGTVSRAFDIWTLGCLFLDFITWFLGGHEYVQRFQGRRTTIFINGSYNDIFFALMSGQKEGTYVARVKPEVTMWIHELRCHPRCSEFLHRALDVIEKTMLVVLADGRTRSSSKELRTSFHILHSSCEKSDDFTRGKPWGENEFRIARERMAADDEAVEASPNANAKKLMEDFKKPLVSTMQDDLDWDNWFQNEHPTLDGSHSGLVLILARRPGEPKLDPVNRLESDDWVKTIRKVTADVGHKSPSATLGPGGQRILRNLPFSDRSFRNITKEFYIHESITRIVSRADVSDFSAVKLEMGKRNGRTMPAYVYNSRTSNAWDHDLALSATYFPHCGLTFAIMFGCSMSVEAEVLTRLGTATYETCHPLLMPGILVELERKRHIPLVEETLDELEARIQELDENPESIQGLAEKEKVARKEAKRSAWLDMLYLRNQLINWSTCLEMLYKHTNHLNRTVFRDTSVQHRYIYDHTEESSDQEETPWDSGSDTETELRFKQSVYEDSLPDDIGEKASLLHPSETNSTALQLYYCQQPEPLSVSKAQMRITGIKIKDRLRDVMKDYNEKTRDCTRGIEGMVMATQWAQGETNVEIALATSQDSRHMRSIALVTMIFLPGTFFASIFSMGFFEWDGIDGAVAVSRYFWIYVVLAVGFTVLTVGVWWYLGVYRYSRHRNWETGRRFPSNLRLLRQLTSQKVE
ncbi:hypothetical protein FSARC_5212 [Fusarium sarcochroum]|uniref:Protein kinase domain-containing protein n=1 Tax=Fusarium sarcochroum TaxID=1208366 RepID=A0A8H4XAH1_9HYPO|nr:hypothetical protein FSARC_5212 [Fusarium sarcochroum]